MAHPSKFVSVNLNKSYCQQPPRSSATSNFSNGRPRSGGGGGGGMVVLSRPRSSGSAGQKGPPKVSVPPPMNLPSMRKEHERFNPSSTPGSSSRPGSSGFGPGAGSSAMGWTKPALPSITQDKEGGASGDQRAGSHYLPPGVRTAGASSPSLASEKAVVLRGEEFPSLQATIAPAPKPKEKPEPQLPLEMRSQMRSSRLGTIDGREKDEGSIRHSGPPHLSPKLDKYFPGPLPLVRLSHTSDWADDERDTGLRIPDRDRGFARTDSTRGYDLSDDRGARDAEGGSIQSREFHKGDSFGRDVAPSKDARDVSSWRTPQARDWFNSRETGVNRDRNEVKPGDVGRQMSKESNYGYLPHVDNAHNGFSNGGTRDSRSGSSIQNWRNAADTFNGRAADQTVRGQFADLSTNQRGGNAFLNVKSKGPLSSGTKGFSMNDPMLSFGREKRPNSNSGRSYIADAGLDSSDPFAGQLIRDLSVTVPKRKKDMLKEVDFHDPVRESFEAELERVQRIQELERQRVIEEQARVLELARREQEERERLVREEEERRRHIEEKAKEAAWKVEQERLEAVKRAEELKLAREEERRKFLMEEERRKEAARHKLLELEERIARRQTEANLKEDGFQSVVAQEQQPEPPKERDAPRMADIGDWEESERMVEHITIAAAESSSNPNGKFSILERGKHVNNWRRDTNDTGNSLMFFPSDQENDYHVSRRDGYSSARVSSRKEIRSNLGPYVRPYSRGRTSEPSHMPDDLRHAKGNRWLVDGDGDYMNRNSDTDFEFPDIDKFGRSYQNSEIDRFSPPGRFRHSLRQPRVLPPPTISSMHKVSLRAASEHPSSSSFPDSEMRYQHAGISDDASYDHAYHERLQQPGTTVPLLDDTVPSHQKEDNNSMRYDSQSSLSVSSPPTSPTHLSHDDLDVSEDSQLLPTSATGEQTVLSDNEDVMSRSKVGSPDIMATSSSLSLGEDDEWATENRVAMQEQDEYDEDDDGYQDEEEAHDDGDENLGLGQEFEDGQSGVADTTSEVDQVVLGFDEGVEVRIPINDECAPTFRNSENTVGIQAGSVAGVQELIGSDGHMLETEDVFPEGNMEESSKIINETEKALQELVLDPVASTSYSQDFVEGTSNLGMSAQQPLASDFSTSTPTTSSAYSVLSSVSSVASHSEEPIKLQFGLFSGPSLIPSPVPSIQIGSIKMPLHLHHHMVPSMHSSQPPFFQFGQLRYPSPISPSILPLAPQNLSFGQAPVTSHYSLGQNFAVHNQKSQGSPSLVNSGDKAVSAPVLIDKQTNQIDLSQGDIRHRQVNALPNSEKNEVAYRSQNGRFLSGDAKSRYGSNSGSQAGRRGIHDVTLKKYYRPVANNKEPQLHVEYHSSQLFSGGKALAGSKAAGTVSGSRGKRFAYSVRNAGSRSFFPGAKISTDPSGFQRRARRNIRRTEFRVREDLSRKHTEAESFNCDDRPNSNLKVSVSSARYGSKKDAFLRKSTKVMGEPENLNSDASSSQVAFSHGKMNKIPGKQALSRNQISSPKIPIAERGNIITNGSIEEDAPLQSGVVRVFSQPGIEAPSDEDDFIQVRSKRQMLNDRREQREKEMKAKFRGVKAPRKHHFSPHSNVDTYNSKKAAAYFGGDTTNVQSDVITNGKRFANLETSTVFTANVAPQQLLLPIGTPAVNALDTTSESLKSSQRRQVPAISSHGTNLVPGLSYENENASMPLGSWDDADINQQVMALTQSQLDDSMQSVQFDSSSIAHEPSRSNSVTTKEKTFSSLATPLDSLLAGEKIQFGAVTSPTILPPVSRPVSNGIGPPVSSKLSAAKDDPSVFFDKDKCPDEAEAAASAVAVAAINDETDGNRLGGCPVAVPESKSFSGADAIILTPRGDNSISKLYQAGSRLPLKERVDFAAGQSAAEEPLTVALPADLSVDSPSLPLWSPLPRPESSSGTTMLSHFPSHFPCYELNPMLGFTFGRQDESAGTQAQQQQSTTLSSGPWPPQCHSAVDSFYGPGSGFAGPFIGPGGPPHMVVYNHFTPVGQFGQVGLSFMGTTYIPTGKQPDWKHNPAAGAGEGDISNPNVVSSQHNPPTMPSIQHLAPGSPLMPMASPLTMFDMAPFQASTDLPLQAHWSHISAPPMLSSPQQQQQQPPQFSRGLPVVPSAGKNRFHETHSDVSLPEDASTKFPNELGRVQPPASRTGTHNNQGSRTSKSLASTVANSIEVVCHSSKPPVPQQQTSTGQQYLNLMGDTKQKAGSRGEWYRRMGYQGRNQNSGAEKNFGSPSKVKQIYVAKMPAGGTSATG